MSFINSIELCSNLNIQKHNNLYVANMVENGQFNKSGDNFKLFNERFKQTKLFH